MDSYMDAYREPVQHLGVVLAFVALSLLPINYIHWRRRGGSFFVKLRRGPFKTFTLLWLAGVPIFAFVALMKWIPIYWFLAITMAWQCFQYILSIWSRESRWRAER